VAKGTVSGVVTVNLSNNSEYLATAYQDFGTSWRDFGHVIPKSIPDLRNVFNGRCLDADWANTNNGQGTKLWDCAPGSTVQQWTYNKNGNSEFTVQVSGRERCLDADLGTINANGTKVQLWDCNGSEQQHWVWTTDGQLRNQRGSRCLDFNWQNNVNGSRDYLWDCASGSQVQKWFR
jgi:hypothetical protein